MPLKRFLIIFIIIATGTLGQAQEKKKDSSSILEDTLFTDYDALFSELDSFLDSIMAPRSFTLLNLSANRSYYSYVPRSGGKVTAVSKILLSPSLTYYHRSGFGLGAAVNVIEEDRNLNPYQYSLTASWDYVHSRSLVTGVSFTRFWTRDSLAFYTSPLQNAANAYITYRKWWLKPTIAASYGWGSRSSYSQRANQISLIRLQVPGSTTVTTEESINDLSLTASLRHDFFWLRVWSKKDFIRLTPQVIFVSGTQRYGFNQSSGNYGALRNTGLNLLYQPGNTKLDEEQKLRPVSLTATIKAEYSIGKFFVQPQVLFDHYFPAASNNFNVAYVMNAGLIF